MKISPLESLTAGKLGVDSSKPVSLAAIHSYQMDKLAETVAYASRNSPFYREKFAAISGLDEVDAEMFALLPFTSEEELRGHGAEMLCVSQDEVARIITMQSSGTTGAPKRLFFSEDDLEQTLDFFHHGMQPLVSSGERVLILLPGKTPDSAGDLLARGLARMEVGSHIYGLVADPVEAVKALVAHPCEVILGFPVQILALARCAAALKIDMGRIRSVLLCSDYISKATCHVLSELWQCQVFSHYGTVETGLGGGVECEARSGCHLRETDLFFEVICPQTGAVLAPGEFGEIVFSTLHRRAMPLIRYRTGDYGRLHAGPCPCGSNIRRLDRVRGRINQVRELKNGCNLSMADLDEILLPVPGILDFQAVLERVANCDQLSLRLTLIPGQADTVLQEVRARLQGLADLKDLSFALELEGSGRIQPGKRVIEEKRA
ncbi:MAG: phenylacetate--CoA ligase family protein [Desulfobulbaceae bacterium]|nr:phenylacetate--CoA ligase family protein [Desulfobulbaceae bacterium]